MSPAPRHAPLHILRDAATVAVDASSLRKVATRVGMSPSGLRSFLDGTEPHKGTVRKLNHWFLAREGGGGATSTGGALAALGILLDGFPEHRASNARRKMLDTLHAAFTDAGILVPAWLDELGRE